jgi:DNA-binding MarR family transcriptional regulator
MYFMWLTTDEQRVWRNYLAMSSRLQGAMNRQLQSECRLSLADYDVLVALGEVTGRGREEQSGECRIGELGERLGWEQSRLSHQLRRMRSRGLVARANAADDRRAATIGLTDAGRAALAAAAPGHAELVRGLVFADLKAGELRALLRWTSGVLSRLDGLA